MVQHDRRALRRPPEISYFETPVVVDNASGKTILDAAE
jgi:hypothetical protein